LTTATQFWSVVRSGDRCSDAASPTHRCHLRSTRLTNSRLYDYTSHPPRDSSSDFRLIFVLSSVRMRWVQHVIQRSAADVTSFVNVILQTVLRDVADRRHYHSSSKHRLLIGKQHSFVLYASFDIGICVISLDVRCIFDNHCCNYNIAQRSAVCGVFSSSLAEVKGFNSWRRQSQFIKSVGKMS
jgi:hypothetical protein